MSGVKKLSSVPKATAQPNLSISRVTNTADDVKPHKSNIKAHSPSEHDMNRADDFKTDTIRSLYNKINQVGNLGRGVV